MRVQVPPPAPSFARSGGPFLRLRLQFLFVQLSPLVSSTAHTATMSAAIAAGMNECGHTPRIARLQSAGRTFSASTTAIDITRGTLWSSTQHERCPKSAGSDDTCQLSRDPLARVCIENSLDSNTSFFCSWTDNLNRILEHSPERFDA